jgi:hypothetical protein
MSDNDYEMEYDEEIEEEDPDILSFGESAVKDEDTELTAALDETWGDSVQKSIKETKEEMIRQGATEELSALSIPLLPSLMMVEPLDDGMSYFHPVPTAKNCALPRHRSSSFGPNIRVANNVICTPACVFGCGKPLRTGPRDSVRREMTPDSCQVPARCTVTNRASMVHSVPKTSEKHIFRHSHVPRQVKASNRGYADNFMHVKAQPKTVRAICSQHAVTEIENYQEEALRDRCLTQRRLKAEFSPDDCQAMSVIKNYEVCDRDDITRLDPDFLATMQCVRNTRPALLSSIHNMESELAALGKLHREQFVLQSAMLQSRKVLLAANDMLRDPGMPLRSGIRAEIKARVDKFVLSPAAKEYTTKQGVASIYPPEPPIKAEPLVVQHPDCVQHSNSWYDRNFPKLGTASTKLGQKSAPIHGSRCSKRTLRRLGFSFGRKVPAAVPVANAANMRPVLCAALEQHDDNIGAVPANDAAHPPVEGVLPDPNGLVADPMPEDPGPPPKAAEYNSAELYQEAMEAWKPSYKYYVTSLDAWKIRKKTQDEQVRATESADKIPHNELRAIAPIKMCDSHASPMHISAWLRNTRTNLISRGVTTETRQVELAATYLEAGLLTRWQLALKIRHKMGNISPVKWLEFQTCLLTSTSGKSPAQTARDAVTNFRWGHGSIESNIHAFQKALDTMETTIPGTYVSAPDGSTLKDLFVGRILANCPMQLRIAVTTAYQLQLTEAERNGLFITLTDSEKSVWFMNQMRSMLLQTYELAKTLEVKVPDSNLPKDHPKDDWLTAQGRQLKQEKNKVKRRADDSPKGQPSKKAPNQSKNDSNPNPKWTEFKDLLATKGIYMKDLHQRVPGQTKTCLYCGQNHMPSECTADLAKHVKDKRMLTKCSEARGA